MQPKDATILIVEDEPVLREIITAWFERFAGRVLTASNGGEALEIVAANPPDLVVSDVRMPVMDGVTLLKKLRALGDKPPVILISGFSDTDEREAYDMGAEAFLHKPMERSDVLETVERNLISREELWRTPLNDPPLQVLEMDYPSLSEALQEQKIAFGRGGFCVATPHHVAEGPIGIRLNFKDEKKILEGAGVVRWSAPTERQSGIELLYLVPDNREWWTRLIAKISGTAFIPASPSAHGKLAATG
jgi:CheY-like chemotaxis protein